MSRTIALARTGGDYICVAINTGKRETRIFLTEDQLAHLGHRAMAFAAGGYGFEVVAKEVEEVS